MIIIEEKNRENNDWFICCLLLIVISYFLGSYFVIKASPILEKYQLPNYCRTLLLTLTPPVFMVSSITLLTMMLGRFKTLFEICRFTHWKFFYIPEGILLECLFFIPLLAFSLIVTISLKLLEGTFPETVKYLEVTSKAPQLFIMKTDWLSFTIFALAAVVIAPIVEEIVFRGIMFNSIKKYTNQYVAAGLTALIFAAFHCNFIQFIPLFVLGLVFQTLYIYHKSIFPCIIYHAVHNGLAMTILFVVKYLNVDINV